MVIYPTSCLTYLTYFTYVFNIRTFDDELVFIRQSIRYFHIVIYLHFNLPLNSRYSYTLFLRVEGLGVQSPLANVLADSQVKDLQNREYTRNPFYFKHFWGVTCFLTKITLKHILYAMHINNPNTWILVCFTWCLCLDSFMWYIVIALVST